jgi:cytochrome c
MQKKPFLLLTSVGVFFLPLVYSFIFVRNSKPEVKIITPEHNSKFQWNSTISYAIRVVDAEDGNSDYDEIAANEVLLKVDYLADSANLPAYQKQTSQEASLATGLQLMQQIICFNCHSSKNKLIGPSFDLISAKYPYNKTNEASLVQKIINGSSKVWGDVIMPPNPALTQQQAKQIIRWILTNNRNPDSYYLAGLSGSFQTNPKPKNGNKGVYVLTAIYIDRGDKNSAQSKKRGYHTVVLHQ